MVLGTAEPGGEVVTSAPRSLRDRPETLGTLEEIFPESLEEGRETEVGPSLFVDLRREDCREEAEPPEERDREREEGAVAGGGSGGGGRPDMAQAGGPNADDAKAAIDAVAAAL